MKRLSCFEDFVSETQYAKNLDELFAVLSKHVKEYGFERVLFGLATDHKSIGLKAGIGVAQNYPSDWMQHYHTMQYEKIDPVVTVGKFMWEPFMWDKFNEVVELKKEQITFMGLSDEAGLKNGMTIPLHGGFGQIAGISLTTSERKDACHVDNAVLVAIANHFYTCFMRIQKINCSDPNNIILTAREHEVLTWAAKGKKDPEIAKLIGTSEHNVNKIFRRIFEKLKANERVLAVTKALSLGLIAI